MPNPRDIRRLAMQVLYQFDLRGAEDAPAIGEALEAGPDAADVHEPAFALAGEAWRAHREADRLVAELAPQWPTHRQPPVDRAILRLAHYEMIAGRAPPKVVINEAIELAKQFASEQSPPFINGVLDKMARRLAAEGRLAPAPASDSAAPPPATGADPWLRDALSDDFRSEPPA